MIVIDTSVWADHLREPIPAIGALHAAQVALMHPFVVGELAAGHMPHWKRTVAALRLLRRAPVVGEEDFYAAIAAHNLMGTGLGFVDLHLLVTTLTIENGLIWSRDRRLVGQAERLGCVYLPV